MSQVFEPIEPEPFPEEWLTRIKPELTPGEQLIWAGQSIIRETFSGRKVAAIWASCFVIASLFGFAGLFGAFGSRFHAVDGALATLGVFSAVIAFFILVGIAINILESGFGTYLLVQNLYALTDERAILWDVDGQAVTVRSISKRRMKGTHRVEYPDGSGTVYFEQTANSVQGFVNIPDARRVEELIRRVLIQSRPELPPHHQD